MSLKEVALPGGGRVWTRTRLSHERAVGKAAAAAGMLSTKSVIKLRTAYDAVGEDREKLQLEALDDLDLAEALRQQGAMRTEVIRICVHHWSGVYGPDSDTELVFPDDVPQLDEDEFDALYIAVESALTEGRADPNRGGAPSRSGSTPNTDAGQTTPPPTSSLPESSSSPEG